MTEKQNRCCETCSNMIPIGSGDHICADCGGKPVIVVSDYQPTNDYFKCNGKKWCDND